MQEQKDSNNQQICSKCKEIKAINEFVKDKRIKSGYRSICRKCNRLSFNEWAIKTNYKWPTLYEKCNGDLVLSRAKIIRNSIVTRCREKGFILDSNITVNYIAEMLYKSGRCECCGKDLDFTFKGINNYNSPTIDRLDSKLGYCINNICALCWRCNILKNDSTLAEIEMVYEWMKKKQQK